MTYTRVDTVQILSSVYFSSSESALHLADQKLLEPNQGLLVWMRVKKSKTATMDLSTGEDGPEQSRAASLCGEKHAVHVN